MTDEKRLVWVIDITGKKTKLPLDEAAGFPFAMGYEELSARFESWLERQTPEGDTDTLTTEEIGEMFREWEKERCAKEK